MLHFKADRSLRRNEYGINLSSKVLEITSSSKLSSTV